MLRNLIVPALLAVAWIPPAWAQNSLCAAGETTVFACRTGPKMVSVCASLEMTLPAQSLPPAKAATGDTLMFSGGGGAWLRFANGPVAYTVYTGIGNWGPNGEVREKAGLAVERQGKLAANLACTGKVTSELGPEWFSRAGIASGGQEFDLPD